MLFEKRGHRACPICRAAPCASARVLVPRITSHESNGEKNRSGAVLHKADPGRVRFVVQHDRAADSVQSVRSDTSVVEWTTMSTPNSSGRCR